MLNLNNTLSIHQRIAELWVISQMRQLTSDETEEWNICMKCNVNHCWADAYEYNMAIMDLMVSNVNYDDEIPLE